MVLAKMKDTAASDFLGEAVEDAVITGPGLLRRFPAPGHEGRRQDRRPQRPAHHQRADRGRAGLRLDRPNRTAASRSSTSAAGTFDISILEIADGVFEVQHQRRHLSRRRGLRPQARREPDERTSKSEHGIDLREDKMALQR